MSQGTTLVVPMSPLFIVIPSGLQPARDLLFDFFGEPLAAQECKPNGAR